MTRWIALLRAVNVGKRRLPMAELRALAEELGYVHPRTYVASGNLLFDAPGTGDAIAALLEKAIAGRFGFTSEVVLRSAAQWRRYAEGSPFPDADAKFLHLILSREAPAADAAAKILARAAAGERVAAAHDAVWIDYAGGVARSKLTPAVLDRCMGSPATGRNRNSVLKLAALAEQ